ncbi:hypothetical protein [Collimonas pratensis]|uniref:Excinuclease ATPase subunit domain protein n=1 Tax=Collimonas pratensis TaxID=279113 RepID=A0ABN4MHW1_9BURK|nr:hypothetical protein [Collimonas pratensis]AMP17353.1 excinuclease ATPase subunit domain protein [Collimonas pratensis]
MIKIKKAGLSLPRIGLLASLLFVSVAQARNTTLMMPIKEVLEQDTVKQTIGPDMTIVFGSATPSEVEFRKQGVVVEGQARPNKIEQWGHSVPLDDASTCQLALGNALQELARQARQSGANAIVGIVSYYKNKIFDSGVEYECHAGMSRAVVTLKANLGKGPGPIALDAGKPGVSRQPIPPASNFAAVGDIQRVPFLDDKGRQGYRIWLTKTPPKVFVISENGRWNSSWGGSGPEELTAIAMKGCINQSGTNCQLYAVDSHVVYRPSVTSENAQAIPVSEVP